MVADGDKLFVGKPLLTGASVKATIVSHGRGDKVRIFKMRAASTTRRTKLHRNPHRRLLYPMDELEAILPCDYSR